VNQQIKILIGTPCAQGQLSVQYLMSLMDVYRQQTMIKHSIFVRDNLRAAKNAGLINEQNAKQLADLEAANLINVELGIYTLSSESLLTRGRNHIAAVALRQGWDKLFFIDADASFNFQQFMSVALSPYDLTAGACPLKCFPINLNYLPFQKDEHYYRDRIRSVDSFLKMKEGHGAKYVPVAYIGTAFMCISRKLLLAAAENEDEYQYPNPQTGHLHTHWNMFNTVPMHGKFMSEDWYFCERSRQLGYPVMMDTDVIIEHVGTHVFSAHQAYIKHITTPGVAS